ncbi:MAG: hypothetical protein P0Y49_14485 [Candidatus Pedobacter colombiensis]|uniref:Uncharacterized protein n=1 Tax=Candidatus Pedobacter colombiensis TaxID=3121371 RepID=A0AAJ6B5Z5_9SPHI|nr:hypothetical protein [Pedobacter sp.]WEK18001.1 MAG: hypothetical protein P0Y49_14485 [Pedobacter sp.]
MESLANLARNKLKISEKDRYPIPFLVKTNRIKTYELTSGDMALELNRWTTPIPIDPIKPPKDPNEGYNYSLSIIKNNQSIEINDRDQNRTFFIKYFDTPYSPSKEHIIDIIKSHISKIDSNIERIDKNKNLVKDRGLPLSQFAYDTFMKSVQQDQNIFKILSWKSRILYMLQLVLTVLIIFPFLIDIKERIIKRISH